MIELLPNDYDTLRRSFDDLRYGGFSSYPLVGLGSLTMFDPSRVPAGKATMHAWDYVPYERARRPLVGRHQARVREAHDRAHGPLHRRPAARTSSRITATARSTWSARRRASAAATCTASRRRATSPARTGRRPSSARCTVPGVRAALSRRPVPASGRRRVRRGPRGGDARVRRPGNRVIREALRRPTTRS